MPDFYDPNLDGPLKELVIDNTLSAAKAPESAILGEIEKCGYSEEAVFAIKLSLEEAMTNAVRHGNWNDASKRITVRYAVSPRRTVIMVADEGPGFALDTVPDPTLPENLERPNGRGIMLMKAYMTDVGYNEAGNEVRLLKVNDRWQQDPATPTGR